MAILRKQRPEAPVSESAPKLVPVHEREEVAALYERINELTSRRNAVMREILELERLGPRSAIQRRAEARAAGGTAVEIKSLQQLREENDELAADINVAQELLRKRSTAVAGEICAARVVDHVAALEKTLAARDAFLVSVRDLNAFTAETRRLTGGLILSPMADLMFPPRVVSMLQAQTDSFVASLKAYAARILQSEPARKP